MSSERIGEGEGAKGNLRDLRNGNVANARHVTRQKLVTGLEGVPPELGQSTALALRVHIPQIS